MKIALINYTHADRMIGGVETRYQLLARALQDAGHQCEFVATEHVCYEEAVLVTSSCDVAISDSAVCFPTVCPMITIFGNAWRGVLSVEDSEHVRQVVSLESRWHHTHDTLRVAVSNYMAREEMRSGGIVAWHTIPNPADIGRFSKQFKKNYPPTILWIGPFIAIKDHRLMETVRGLLPLRHPDLNIQWQFSVRNGESALNYDQMTEAISKAALVLCTSVAEGCSNTLMEAIAADVPIVTTRTGLFWDWWDSRFGIRIEEHGDVDAFVCAIHEVITAAGNYLPRQAALDAGLDYRTWALRWRSLVVDYAERCRT